jgi:ribonucleoside-diphosphate reductase alpha chain
MVAKVIKRNGDVVDFDIKKIENAIAKALINSGYDRNAVEQAKKIASSVCSKIFGEKVSVDEIHNIVENELMDKKEFAAAKSYVLYREKRDIERKEKELGFPVAAYINDVCNNYGIEINKTLLLKEVYKNTYAGASHDEIKKAILMSARCFIEKDVSFNRFCASLLEWQIFGELHDNVIGGFREYINRGVSEGILIPDMLTFNIASMAKMFDRKINFDYIGIQTLYDRYLLRDKNGKLFEAPQYLFARVAMALAVNEKDKDQKAIEFYELLSSFDFMSSTPTLFNAGTKHQQLSSCYLSTVDDSLKGIFDFTGENAVLSKHAGGLGMDFSPVRGMGAKINGTNGKSQGVVPFLKIVNDMVIAVNQGGKRKGSACVYLETWHLDIEEFLELRKNTGDDRRRTHDMNTANWIPDLFMKRQMFDKEWTLFSPDECPDLHDLYGKEFDAAYEKYEEKAKNGEIKNFKVVSAKKLWQKMMTMLFETGHPWITFKDACNVRSPQQHVGVVHSSNLCTEITLNTNEDEIAVCNLGSVNLKNHLTKNSDGAVVLDMKKLEKTISIAMRMLDNVIDLNYYPVDKAKNSNMKHRPVGLGLMGFQDCLYEMRIPYDSQEAVEFSDASTEAVCYYAYLASSNLAKERGAYKTYKGSLWSKGVLPIDTIEMLNNERGGFVDCDKSETLGWYNVVDSIKEYGMRNSNCVAIAPTATISNIIGVSASIEPTYQNLYVKSNLSGEFTIINEYLIKDLEKLGILDDLMIMEIKENDGSIQNIDRIPNDLKRLYKTAFDIDPVWLIECAARRQKWIDQAQSLNIYMSGDSGKKMSAMYELAWIRGLKTTYYFRSLGATSAEKSTIDTGSLNQVKVCSLENQDCEACQ